MKRPLVVHVFVEDFVSELTLPYVQRSSFRKRRLRHSLSPSWDAMPAEAVLLSQCTSASGIGAARNVKHLSSQVVCFVHSSLHKWPLLIQLCSSLQDLKDLTD